MRRRQREVIQSLSERMSRGGSSICGTLTIWFDWIITLQYCLETWERRDRCEENSWHAVGS